MTARVLIIDDDDITRAGMATVLGRADGISVVGTASHSEIEEGGFDWALVDVALVDASDHRRPDDQYPGVDLVRRIRAESGARVRVIVVTGVVFDEAVRHRMREAGADLYYHRTELVDGRDLCSAVLGRRDPALRPKVVASEEAARAGVTDASRVNRGIEAARDLGLTSGRTNGGVHRGRAQLRRRAAFNERARLVVTNADGTTPDRVQEAPSMPQIARFLDWATQIPERRRRSSS